MHVSTPKAHKHGVKPTLQETTIMILEVRPQQCHVKPFADTPIPLNPKHIVEVLIACQPKACHTIPAFLFLSSYSFPLRMSHQC